MKAVEPQEQKLVQLKTRVISFCFFLLVTLSVKGQKETIDMITENSYKEISKFESQNEDFFCFLISKNSVDIIYTDDDNICHKLRKILSQSKGTIGDNSLFLTIGISKTSNFYFRKSKTLKIIENCAYRINDTSLNGPIWFREILITPPVRRNIPRSP